MAQAPFAPPKLSFPLVVSLIVIAAISVALNLAHKKPARLDITSLGIQYQASYCVSELNIEVEKLYLSSKRWLDLTEDTSQSIGFSDQALWLRLDLQNLSHQEQDFLLHLNNNLTDHIELFYFDQQGQLLHKRDYGDSLPFHSREVPIKSYAIPIDLKPNQRGSYLIKLSGQSALSFHLQFLDQDKISELIIGEYLTLGFLFGALFLMAVFSYLLHLASKQRVYFHFSFFVLSTGLALAHLSGAGFSFIWPTQPILNALVFPLSVSLIIFFGNCFFQSIINFNNPEKLKSFFFYAKILAFIPALSLFVSSLQQSYIISLVFFSCGVIVSAAIAIRQCCQGHNMALYYLLSLLVYLAGIILFSLELLGLVTNINTNILFYTGALYQTSILTATIIYYINYNLFENERGLIEQVKALQLEQSKQQKEIDNTEKVLIETYDKLQHNYNEFNQLSQTDALTKLKNRLYFQDFIDHTYQHAKQHQYSICLLFCDLDHFSKINTTYSPILGDKFLLSSAEVVLQQCEKYNNYCCARFSGQEFVIVLPHCNTNQALETAENIRQAIANITHVWKNQKLSITASLGLACHGPKQYRSASTLIEAADKAMVTAKHGGRNQVNKA